MAFDEDRICDEIERSLQNKLDNYKPEPSYKPLHNALLGERRMTSFALIQSINTTMGKLFEDVASEIATGTFDRVETQFTVGGNLASEAQSVITEITNGLATGNIEPDHEAEIEQIRHATRNGTEVATKHKKADLCLWRDQCMYLIDVKTAKPNKGGFEKYKHEMLSWSASVLYANPNATLRTIIGIPYNPYEPRNYDRLNCYQQLDPKQILVGRDFWSFLGDDESTYDRLLSCFRRVGSSMSNEIAEKMNLLSGAVASN